MLWNWAKTAFQAKNYFLKLSCFNILQESQGSLVPVSLPRALLVPKEIEELLGELGHRELKEKKAKMGSLG